MAQRNALIDILKQALKAEGKTYMDVAHTLHLSEASVKRMFAKAEFSLERLDSICAMISLEISDLVQRMNDAAPQLERLSRAQEEYITEDLLLVLVTVCVFNSWTLNNITEYFDISEQDCVKRLLKLDAMRIIELQANNRIKLLVSPNFKWQPNGPFESFFKRHIGQEYFNSSFAGDAQSLTVLNGAISTASAIEFQRKLQRLGREFETLIREDLSVPHADRRGMTLVLGMRYWDYGMFRHLIRPEFQDMEIGGGYQISSF